MSSNRGIAGPFYKSLMSVKLYIFCKNAIFTTNRFTIKDVYTFFRIDIMSLVYVRRMGRKMVPVSTITTPRLAKDRFSGF